MDENHSRSNCMITQFRILKTKGENEQYMVKNEF